MPTLNSVTGTCFASVSAPVAQDNCKGAITGTTTDPTSFTSPGQYVINWTFDDGNGNDVIRTQSVTVTNLIIDASASSNPVPVGTNALLSASISPATSGILINFTLDNGNGGILNYAATTNASGVATVSVPNLPVEVYLVTASAANGCASSTAYLPVFDPNGSFITGGGWINSPAGALTANPAATGKANFGFVSKYKKGSNVPEGNTEFQFHAGNITFKSMLNDAGSLVISGAKATYRGVGTVNGSGNYGFLVAAIDGQTNGGGGYDKFRIKIWDKANGNAVVYDNQMNAMENADATTQIAGGSIVIHETKKAREAAVAEERLDSPAIEAILAPNPANDRVRISLKNMSLGRANIRFISTTGFEVLTSSPTLDRPDTVLSYDIKHLNEGLYYIQVKDASQKTKVIKLMKNR